MTGPKFKINDNDMRKIAEMVVKKSLNIKKGDCAYISGKSNNIQFMNLLAIECTKIGACPFVRADLPSDTNIQTISETSISNLKFNPKHYLAIMDKVDFEIIVSSLSTKKNKVKHSKEMIKKIDAWVKSYECLWDKIMEKKIKVCAITIPSPTGNEVDRLLYQSLTTDLEYMSKVGRRLKKFLTGPKKVHITCNAGTDMTFNIDEDHVVVDDGILDEEDYKDDFQVYLPGGVVCINGVADSANGTVVIKHAYDQWGKRHGVIRNLKLVFKSGKVIRSSSDTNYKIFKDTLDESSGDKDMFAEFGIGTNPKVNKMVYQMKVDELMHGAAHIAIGTNAHCGGKNLSDLHWDFIIEKPTIYVEGVCIVKNGDFTAKVAPSK